MKLPAYPRYKPSGVEWLGEVPEHWEVKRLDFLATVKARLGWKGLTADEYVPDGFIFLSTPNIKGEGDIDFKNVNYITAERYYESPEIMIQVGDVLMAKDGSTLGTTNVVRHLPARTTVNSSIAVLRSRRLINNLYFFRWLTCSYIQSVIHSMKDGQGVPHLFQADLKKFVVLLPPRAEQEAIAAFLERQTMRVDRLVVKKRELIERLKEKRTALISRNVKGGLPPKVARAAGLPVNPSPKPSGLEWLGDIAGHRTLRQIKFLVLTPVTDGPHETPEILDEGIPFVSAEAISDKRINFNKIRGHITIEDHKRFSRKYKPKKGDIYLVKSGATTGRVAMVETDIEFNIWSPLAAIRCDPKLIDRHFLFFFMQSKEFQTAVELSWSYGTQQNIGMGVIQNLRVPVPPLPEQIAIAAYLDTETAKLDALVHKIEEAIERLQEYRTALITAAVTGKIDVRKAAA